jgi:hypothetical protein
VYSIAERDSRPDVVVAFPGGRDAADLVQKAALAGIQVLSAPSLTRKEKADTDIVRSVRKVTSFQDKPMKDLVARVDALRKA